MIFNCPECNAGHSVPVSMIPNGGLDMACRRCGEAFSIEPPVGEVEGALPTGTEEEEASTGDLEEAASTGDLEEAASTGDVDDAPPTSEMDRAPSEELDEELLDVAGDTTEGAVPGEKTSVGPPPLPEATRVGVANPLDERSGARPLVGPGGVEYEVDDQVSGIEADETEAGAPFIDRPTIPIEKDHVPLGPDETGIDPERDETIRFGLERKRAPTPAVTELEEMGESLADPSEVEPLRRRESADGSVDPSVYDRVALGVAVPKGAEDRPASQPSRVDLQPGIKGALRPVADLLNRAPLALKVGLIVFPITLGIMLVVTASSESPKPPADGPIEIPVEPASTAETDSPPSQEEEEAEIDPPPAEEAEAEIDPQGPEDPPALPAGDPPGLDDPPAPAGFSYVQVDNARIRARAGTRSTVAGRLEMGALVKVYEELDGWALVSKQPKGPAGFISRKLLGDRRPVAQLAREQPFERCAPGDGYSVDDCLYESKQQERTCLERCGAVNAADEKERLRCAQVCSIAFDACAQSCRKVSRRKRRRRRR